jgi:hypothetical protein
LCQAQPDRVATRDRCLELPGCAWHKFAGRVSFTLAGVSVQITPVPTDEETAAIMAAVEALWPKPHLAAIQFEPERTLAWRFSGRWWQRDRMASPDRPWR